MKAFSEKSDRILRSLIPHFQLCWQKFTQKTKVEKGDVLLHFLKERKKYIDFSDEAIFLTKAGRAFIENTSFVEIRDKRHHS